MNNDKKEPLSPQPQTAANPSGDPVSHSFRDGQATADRDIQQAGEASEKEQQFKEAQTERD